MARHALRWLIAELLGALRPNGAQTTVQ